MSWAEITRLDPPKRVSQGGYSAVYAYAFRFSFRPDLVDDLKAAISWHGRAWEADTKTWYVVAHGLDALKALALACDEATLIEGNLTTCLRTGRVTEQGELFT